MSAATPITKVSDSCKESLNWLLFTALPSEIGLAEACIGGSRWQLGICSFRGPSSSLPIISFVWYLENELPTISCITRWWRLEAAAHAFPYTFLSPRCLQVAVCSSSTFCTILHWLHTKIKTPFLSYFRSISDDVTILTFLFLPSKISPYFPLLQFWSLANAWSVINVSTSVLLYAYCLAAPPGFLQVLQ